LYGLNKDRIYTGRIPPLLYAVGVLQVEVDSRGNVRDVNWMRAPKHAPEVMAEIERTVRAAAPFPAARRGVGRVDGGRRGGLGAAAADRWSGPLRRCHAASLRVRVDLTHTPEELWS